MPHGFLLPAHSQAGIVPNEDDAFETGVTGRLPMVSGIFLARADCK